MQVARAWGVRRSVLRHEWSDQDRDWAFALIAYERSLCPGCGHARDDTHDPTSEDAYDAHASRCHACAAAARKAASVTDPAGLYLSTVRRDDPDG